MRVRVRWIVVPGFGAIDLSVTWDPEWQQVLEAGWGLYFTVLVAVPFVVAASARVRRGPGRPTRRRDRGARVSAPLANGDRAWPSLAAVLGLETAVVAGSRAGLGPAGARETCSCRCLVLAAVGAVPWLAYAFEMWALNREDRSDSDITNGVDHYSVQGGVGLALAVLPALAAVRADLRPLVPACAGVVAAYLGLVSYAWPDAAGGFGRPWSVAAMAWGVVAGRSGGVVAVRARVVSPE